MKKEIIYFAAMLLCIIAAIPFVGGIPGYR